MVVACSAEARAAGLRSAMSLAEARVLVADLIVAEADPEADAALLARIATHAARRWTPLAAVDPPDGLLLDIGATAHLFGGEAALARTLLATARRAGLAARVAVADSAGAAHALARYGGAGLRIVPPGEDAVAIAPLPPAALRIEAETAAAIGRLGFATIGDLLEAPRAPLIRRFGQSFGRRIEQMLGKRAEPIEALVPPAMPSARRSLLEPIATAEAIAKVIEDLAPDLCERLEERHSGARRVLLLCRRVDGRDETVAIGLARPSRDAAHLAELLRRRIETIDPGFGIEAMLLLAPLVEPLAPSQIGRAALAGRAASRPAPARDREGAAVIGLPPDRVPSDRGASDSVSSERASADGASADGQGAAAILAFPSSARPVSAARPAAPPQEEEPDLPALIDRLANRFGPAALHRVGLRESDTPERMVARLAPLAPPTGRGWRVDWPRPSRLLRRPEPIANAIAEIPDHAPAAFTWRGTRYRVVAADGPERICGEWWRGGAKPLRVRDYFQVEVTDGGRYWLFRTGDGVHADAGPGDWFLHGAFG